MGPNCEPALSRGDRAQQAGTVTSTAPPVAGVAMHGLIKTFRSPAGPVRAVRGVDIDIAPGETVALLGPNGAGKSTTIDMLLGLAVPDAGEVHVFGMTPRDAVAHGAIGAMLQTGALIGELSVRELVTMMASLYPEPLAVDDVLQLAGITEIAKRMTNRLSGGESQRTRFAVAMVSNPDLLVLDEPTVAMDVEGRVQFWQTMRRFAERGKTVLFATHYLEEADANADRIVLMARGEVVADGPATEIKAAAGGRIIRATLPGVPAARLEPLDGVRQVELHGEAIILRCSDSDAAVSVRLDSIGRWLGMTGLLIVGLLPFVALGIAVGHLLTIDSMGPAVGGGTAFFGFLGGQWFPLPEHGALHAIGECIPSYWLTQASHFGLGAPAWGVKGWVVVGVWAVGTTLFAAWAYRRDTQRV